jgi:hypothetical protein
MTQNASGELSELDKIAIEAAGDEQQQQAAQDAILNPEPENPVDPAEIWGQIPKMFGGLLAMAMPELQKVYTDKACYQWGVGMAAVAQKYEWDAAETISKYGPEFALIAASVPLAVPTIAAIRERRKERPKKPVDLQDVTPKEDEEGLPQGGNFDEPQ